MSIDCRTLDNTRKTQQQILGHEILLREWTNCGTSEELGKLKEQLIKTELDELKNRLASFKFSYSEDNIQSSLGKTFDLFSFRKIQFDFNKGTIAMGNDLRLFIPRKPKFIKSIMIEGNNNGLIITANLPLGIKKRYLLTFENLLSITYGLSNAFIAKMQHDIRNLETIFYEYLNKHPQILSKLN